ncbi:hypothetical protein HLB23_22455 [Nocardia uniformis]|uniref:Uncharacterized protein n=1 Tax=Nocardia uniformis TaxID=53432 RepID=A0A849C485_9NOCA|nr:hypothetical protein [Nocardia uniformis]NNH72588.1 hypothetical protein [Nocardia uniformis]
MTIEYTGKVDAMLVEYSAMLDRCDVRNTQAREILAEAEALAAETRELFGAEYSAPADEAAGIRAQRDALDAQVNAKSQEVQRLHRENFDEWRRFTDTEW